MEPELIGEVTHFYDKAGVAVVKFKKSVPLHTKVKFLGVHTDFDEDLESMQVDHKAVETAEPGEEVGIKVHEKTREGDRVYRI